MDKGRPDCVYVGCILTAVVDDEILVATTLEEAAEGVAANSTILVEATEPFPTFIRYKHY